jgi:MFS superfamily sulfate permease-like transporter
VPDSKPGSLALILVTILDLCLIVHLDPFNWTPCPDPRNYPKPVPDSLTWVPCPDPGNYPKTVPDSSPGSIALILVAILDLCLIVKLDPLP